MPLASLKNTVNHISPLPEEDWEALSAIWQPYEAARKELLTRAGETEKYLYFVLEGVQRVYYSSPNEKEATLIFMYPPSFAGILDSFLLQKPSRYYFETLTPCRFLRCNYAALHNLMLQYPAIDRMIRVGLTNVIAGLLERMCDLQCLSAEEKFLALMKRSPQVLQLIPHKYLASYLGMDPTNFSKLLGRVRIG